MKKRIWGLEDKIDEIDNLVKKKKQKQTNRK